MCPSSLELTLSNAVICFCYRYVDCVCSCLVQQSDFFVQLRWGKHSNSNQDHRLRKFVSQRFVFFPGHNRKLNINTLICEELFTIANVINIMFLHHIAVSEMIY